MVLSIVVPVYKEEASIPLFLRDIRPILEKITADYEIIFALDPSPDRTEQVILGERAGDPRIKLLLFSRRVGQPMATLAGLEYSGGDAVVVIDVDLQDPPSLIPEMVGKWREGFEVVYAQRRSRDGETWLKRLVAATGYRVINRLADVRIPRNTGDFRLLSRRVVTEVLKLKESHGFLRGLVALVGFPTAAIMFDRPARAAGAGNYNRFLGSLRIGLNGIICFSNRPLALSWMAGGLMVAFALLSASVLVVLKLAELRVPVPHAGLGLLVLFLGGIQLVSVGILGEYIGRIYDEVKQRPRFIVEKAEGWKQG